jgi:galactonate dehydratase
LLPLRGAARTIGPRALSGREGRSTQPWQKQERCIDPVRKAKRTGGKLLQLRSKRIPDPNGHDRNLLLKGDWIILEVSDGEVVGRGEASHSGDDRKCIESAHDLFSDYVQGLEPTVSTIQELELGPFASPTSFLEATAMSALNQALHELLAKRHAIPAWRLLVDRKRRDRVETYATINRALTDRTPEDYESVVRQAVRQGFRAVKCAPFEAVTRSGNQLEQSRQGLCLLKRLRERFPDLSIRVDFHERFRLAEFLEILPELEMLSLHWLEAPIPIGDDCRELMQARRTKIAMGELLFGIAGFRDIVEQRWADVIMPDVKHVGGFGALLRLARHYEGAIDVSPHNPSGPIASLAAAHVCTVQGNVGALELPLITDPARAYYSAWLSDGFISLPSGAGWGSWISLPAGADF